MAEASFIQFLFGQLRTSDGSLAGGTAYFYTVGTSTPKAIYSDMEMTSAIYSIVLDADGSAEVYGSGQYRCVVKDADGVTQYDKDVNFLAPSSYVSAPATNTDEYIPQWDGANSGTLKDGLLLVTTVGATGDDTSIPTEQAVREAITGIVSAATTTSSGTVEIATNAEALAGTDASRSISPASLDYVIDNTPHVLQVVNYSSGAVASTSNQIPYDDTIPQNTEGAEWATLAITPKSATSKLVIDVILNIHTSGWHHAVVGLFQDTTANCLACSSFYGMDGGNVPVTLKYFMVSGTTSATTFKVRYGASSGTTTVNGSSGSRNYGGVLTSSITITEVLV